jgi:hypothetical protein
LEEAVKYIFIKLIISFLLLFTYYGISKESKVRTKLIQDVFCICDSLENMSTDLQKMLKKTGEEKFQFIDVSKYKEATISILIDNVGKKNNYIGYTIMTMKNKEIVGLIVDYFYSDKYVYRLYICFPKSDRILSCCGYGGEFTSRNTLWYEIREKNWSLIKNITNYSVYQFRQRITKEFEYYHEDEKQRFKSLMIEYKKNKKLKNKRK